MLLQRLFRRAAAILMVCLIGTNVSYVAAQTHTPGKSQLGGWVYIDRNNDGQIAFSTDPDPEWMISNVKIRLLSHAGTELDYKFTDQFGRYFFNDLDPGTYALEQVPPIQYVDGIDTAGKFMSLPSGAEVPSAVVDTSVNNKFSNIVLAANVRGDYFNFGELGLASGYVSKRFLEGYEPVMEFGTDEPGFVVPEPATAWLAMTAVGFGLFPRRRRK